MSPPSHTAAPHAARCALLFGLPSDRQEFLARATASPRSDYLTSLLGRRSPATAWDEDYAVIASAASRLIGTAENLGAAVCRKATLQDLAEVSRTHSCLILIAHWRGSIFSVRDLLVSAAEFVRFAQAQYDSVAQMFVGTPPTANEVIDALNRAIEKESLLRFLPKALTVVAAESIVMARTLCRDLLDEVFEGMIVPGNRVELFDGLHSLGDVEEAIAPSFTGELDLATCYSEALATYLDLRRGNRLRHLHWADYILPAPQFDLISEALARLATSGGSYLDIRLTIDEQLRDSHLRGREKISWR